MEIVEIPLHLQGSEEENASSILLDDSLKAEDMSKSRSLAAEGCYHS